MSEGSALERRPILGTLVWMVGLLLAGSCLSSPPWPGAAPLLGLPPDACGEFGRAVSTALLGGLGIPLTVWLCASGLILGARFVFLHPARVQAPLLGTGLLALTFSLFLAQVAPSAGWAWGEMARAGASFLAASGRLGPLGAALALGGGFVLAGIVVVPRLLPGWTTRAAVTAGATSRATTAVTGNFFRRISTSIAGAADAWRQSRAARRDAARTESPKRRRPDRVAEAHGQELTPVDLDALLRAPAAASAKPAAPPPTSREKPTRAKKHDPSNAAQSGRYVLPPIELLEPDPGAKVMVEQSEILENGRTLVRALRDFGIEGQLGQVHPGPVITQYEFEPAAGVRIAQIVSRAEDLALALRSSRVRLVAPIPGKAAVGIEVPNRAAQKIGFRSVLQEIELTSLAGDLPLVLGRDIRGRPHAARLEAMPHALVAGTTGSGKSVCLNVLLLSLLFRRTPDELRLLLIDPKMLELTPYDGIPHLLCPVVTEPKMAARMLGWLVGEMERRYRRMAGFGVRNIEGYRAKVAAAKPEDGLEPMPTIVVIVDELADLMMTCAHEVEGPIARLAQMARAVGIHLILATQRPSVDVLTGVIKANFPARIAFQVASKVDSRTILDANGAESLLGRGDMLFLPPGKSEATRVHGAYVSERDTEAVVQFLKQQPPAPEIFREDALRTERDELGFDDEMFEDALRLVVAQKQASTSFLQRRLKVGYSRAGRLMDLLEKAGAVSGADGSKAREVLADDRFLDQWLQREKVESR